MTTSSKVNCEIKLVFAYCDAHQTINNVNAIVYNDSFEEKSYMLINELAKDLCNQKLIPLINIAISYYDEDLKVYIYCGKIPIKHQIIIPVDLELIKSNSNILKLTLKIRYIQTKINLLKMELIEENQENLDEQNQNVHINEKSKRSKERKIGYIIEKVFLWRKLYNGFTDDNGVFHKYTLEDAADRVGIAKKSLDDYLIQLRIGKNNGFNFNEHKNDKVGVLRAFVKKQKNDSDIRSQTRNNLTLNEDDD